MDETVLYPTTPARQALAAQFNLPYDDAMQDWEWQVANSDAFDQYLAAYTIAMPSDQRFSLMEMHCPMRRGFGRRSHAQHSMGEDQIASRGLQPST
ncbi:hypothetical protein [Ideonella sp.]|uniref:hypothetical protein n=1 Tax=Ideonella sp. TaxID=1929293 RepID=UPI003BB73A79